MKQYELFELTFSGEILTENWAAVDLTATFTYPGGSKTVKGFYDGNGLYKVRFLPEVAGITNYHVSGVIQAEGTEICEPASSDHHGLVKAEGTHLKFSDETYFFSFGTTVYALAHQEEQLIENTFQTLASSPFNKVRLCLFPKHYDYNVNDPELFPFEVKEGTEYFYERGYTVNNGDFLQKKSEFWDVSRPNPAFWNRFEKILLRLQDLGIQADLILFHPYDRWGFSYLSQSDNLLYLDYLLRRLSAFPNVWWSMANEHDLCLKKSMDDWYEIENFIAQNDPYHHMLSNHNCFRTYDFERENITHCSIQRRTMSFVAELMRKYNKPVLYDECVYEGNLKQTWGALSGKEMTNRFWKVTATGGYCTHGEVFLDMDMENIDDAVLWWAKGGALTGSSPARIAFLKNIIEEIGQPLVPNEIGSTAAFVAARNKDTKFLEHAPEQMHILYQIVSSMPVIDLIRHTDAEYTYFGKTEDNSTFLFYYGTDMCARVDIELPEDGLYDVEVIDAWNMTREKVASGISGVHEIKLQGEGYIAVLAKRQ